MRAIQIHEYGGVDQLRIEQVSDPVAGPGEVLVRTAATSVNPIDFKIRSGSAQARFPQTFPVILGRDLAGQVAALGPGVQGFAIGDRVMGLVWRTYAELVVAKASELCLAPSTLDDVQAAALPLVTLTGAQLIERAGQVSAGQTVLVTGALGGVGRCAVFVAKQLGAQVWAGVRRSQLKDGEVLGAARLVPLDDEAALRELPPFDVLADTVGNEPTLKLLPKVKKGGCLASVVGAPEEARALGVRVEAMMTQPDARRMQQLAEDVAAKRLVLPVARVMRFEEIQEAHRLAEQGGAGKIVLRP
jgi:NADPH:quinone reductase-like Zn-dependent oxidoreductase